MDNGYKIKKGELQEQERKDIALFLGKEAQKLRTGGEDGYNLEDEFRKTRVNKSAVVPLVLAGIIVVVIGVSWVLSTFINKKVREVDVDINSFQDLNLRDLLDTAKRYGIEMDNVSRELAALHRQYAADSETIMQRFQDDLALLDALKLENTEYARRRLSLQRQADSDLHNLDIALKPAIQEKELELRSIQEKIAAYDTHSMEEARKQQEILDNQQRLHEIETDQLVSFYEKEIQSMETTIQEEAAAGRLRMDKAMQDLNLKQKEELEALTLLYNPLWAEADPLRNMLSEQDKRFAFETMDQLQNFQKPAALTQSRYDQATHLYQSLYFSIDRMRQLPYTNSVPETLETAAAAAILFGKEYVNLAESSSSLVQNLQQRIRDLQNSGSTQNLKLSYISQALSFYIRSLNVPGLVIDGENPQKVLLYLDPHYEQMDIEGLTAWIFRGDDELIAELTLSRDKDIVIGKRTSQSTDTAIQAFDKVLLKLIENGE